MKKNVTFLLGLLSACALSASMLALAGCNFIGGNQSTDSVASDSITSEANPEHTHFLTRVPALKASCLSAGNLEYYKCSCGAVFTDKMGTQETTLEAVTIEKSAHSLKHKAGQESTCTSNGRLEYWTCSSCATSFTDEAATEVIELSQITLPKAAHDLTHHEEIPVNGKENGVMEHWTCNDCGNYFADEEGAEKIKESDIVIFSVMGIPDFVVEVPVGRDPVVLQLSDTQIIDASQARPGRDGVYTDLWATDQIEERCYDYLTEVITATNPDFIIITGDVVYGEFDDKGTSLTSLIRFMDSFEIPWSPVFGNHDNESKMGVDWQCQQFENSPYCLFEQKDLTGNGNYSVAIAQGGEISRVFYMLDSNGCSYASDESLANGHTYKNFVGFKQDQIDWYTNQITLLKEYVPDVKISFAYHIQQAIFADAYAKYGFNQNEKYQDINLDTMEGVAEGDFGYIGRQMKYSWDADKAIFNGMKALGIDSIFVGHEHCNCVSVVHEGIRFQYGLKSSEYDRFNWLYADGTIEGGYAKKGNSKSMVGGTVIVLSEANGEIEDCYNYYCGFEDGKIDWNDYKPAPVIQVNGLQYGGINATSAQMWADGAVVAETVEFKGVNAYAVKAVTQGKLYINTALLAGKTTFTFTLYMESASGEGVLDPFALRIKPDDGRGANIPGMYLNGTKQYIRYRVGQAAPADEVRLELGVWKTYTVDISSIANGCTEFSFNIAVGNTLYLRDIAIS